MLTFLREAERMLKPLVDSIGEGVLVADERGTPILWNATAERILGTATLRPEKGAWTERPGVFAADGVTHLAREDRPLSRAIRGEAVDNQEFVVRSERGDLILLSCTARSLRDGAERIVGGVAIFREITDSRRAQAALRESERLYRTIADHLPSSIVMMFDRGLRFILAGGGGLVTAGLTPEGIEGHPVAELVTPDILGKYTAVFDGVSSDVEIQRRDRSYRVQLVPVRDEKALIFAGLVLALDITEEKRRKELHDREEQLKLLAEAIPQIVWTAEPDGSLDYYNQRWFDYTGMTLEETQGWGWKPVLHPDDLQSCVDRWTEAVRTGNNYEVEYRFKRASDGAYRWHLGRASPVRDVKGAIIKWFGTCTDIDDQRRAQEVLRDGQKQLEHRVARRTSELAASNEAAVCSEARFRAAAQGMKEAFYIFDAVWDGDTVSDFRLVEANAIGLSRLRASRDQGIGTLYSALYGAARSSGLLDHFARVVTTGEPYDAEIEVDDATIDVKCVHLRAVQLSNGVAVTSSDITEQRRVGRERELHTAIVKNMSEGLCLVGAVDSSIVYTNQKFDEMLGYDPGELQGRPVAILNSAADDAEAQAVAEALTRQIRDCGEATYEIRNVRKDRRVITCRATASVIHDERHGEVFVVLQEDITEKKRLEEERDGFFRMSLDMLCVAGFDGYFKQLNPAWETTMGWTLDELKAKPWLDFVHPED